MTIGSSISKLTCLLLTGIAVCEKSIKWDIKEEYLIYGKDVTLTCNGNSCPSSAIKKWIGGPHYNLLCFDDYSTDPGKYQMMSNYTTPKFDLRIKGFNYSDANCEYTCSCGFQQYTQMLKLEYSNFIYLPVIEEDGCKQTDDTFQVHMSISVFPLPKCQILYKDKIIPVNLIVNNISTETDLDIYRVRLQMILDLKYYSCKGNLNLTCQVRSIDRLLLHRSINFCTDGHEYIYIIIISSIAIILTVLMVFFYRYRYVKAKQFHRTHENLSETSQTVLTSTNRDSFTTESDSGIDQYEGDVEPNNVLSIISEHTSLTEFENG